MTGEDWLPIPGWEGLYEVSSAGRVRSLERVIIRRNGVKYTCKPRIVGPYWQKGSPRVCLARGGTKFTRCVHCIVNEVFGDHNERTAA